jgi:hypothetical protein
MEIEEYVARITARERLESGEFLNVQELKEYPGIVVRDYRMVGLGLLKRRIEFNDVKYPTIAEAVKAWEEINGKVSETN